jgi:hypothetical protein
VDLAAMRRAGLCFAQATALGFALLVAACGNQPATPALQPPPTASEATPDSVSDQVLAVVQQYYADFSARDWTVYAQHFWPGATLTTIWQPPGEPEPRVVTTTVEAFIAQAPQGPGSRSVFEERMTDATVTGNDQLAQVWANYTAKFGEPGALEEWSGIDAFTLMKFEGRWRIVALAYANASGGPGAPLRRPDSTQGARSPR